MITNTPRLTILMVAMTILGTGGPVTALATAYGGNIGDDDSLADKIIDDTNRIIDETLSGLPIIRPPPTAGGSDAICDGAAATIVGTSGDDFLVGTEVRDVIVGLGGDDIIEGRGGDDNICGGAGNDRLDGEDGNERMNGDDGDDDMDGGAGLDVMRGDRGNDNISSIDGVVNNDRLDGGTGNNTCFSDPDPEVNCEA
jgi:Ca2+-binding RTX toxin-like protein